MPLFRVLRSVKFINRLKLLPFENLLFFSILLTVSVSLYRFVFPLAMPWFLPAFLFQFLFGFLPQVHSRKFGRIFTAMGAILLCRISWIIEPSLPFHLTDLVGLFVGSISGIVFRETALVCSGVGEIPLPKQSDFFVTQWQIRNPLSVKQESLFFQTPFYFLYWLVICIFCVFLLGFGFSFLKGYGIPEYQYLDGISSRVFLSVPTNIFLSVGLPILYFFAEERFSSTTNKEFIKKHLFFGLFLGFLIQLVVMFVQTIFLPIFFSNGSNSSLLAERYPGLFIDSGSSSWLLPTLGFLFVIFLYKKSERTKESFGYFLLIVLFFIVTFLGFHQAKAFWVIWAVSLFVGAVWVIPSKWIHNRKILWAVRGTLILFTPLLLSVLFWSFSKLTTPGPVQELGKRYVSFQTSFWEKKNFSAFQSLDQTRFELLSVTYEGISKQPWTGNGLGSLPVILRDVSRTGTKITSELIDVPSNFLMAVLHDVGIFGLLILIMLTTLFVWERMSYLSILLLLLPFQFGMQTQHADGGFFVMYLLFYPLAEVPTGSRLLRISNWFKYSVLILAIGLPLHYFLLFTQDIPSYGYGSEFRKSKLGTYQIQASVYAQTNVMEHEFHGTQYEWKLAKELGFRKGDFIIRSEEKDLLIELIWKNGNRVVLLESAMEPISDNRYIWKGTMPAGSEYVHVKISKKSILKISKNYFSPNGELRF